MAKAVADNTQRKCLEIFSQGGKGEKGQLSGERGCRRYGLRVNGEEKGYPNGEIEASGRRERARRVRQRLWEKCHGAQSMFEQSSRGTKEGTVRPPSGVI